MKRIFCPKCDTQLSFDETKYPDGKILAFVCPQCGSQFKIKLGRKTVRTESGQEKEVKEPDFSCGYITVIENTFGFKQELPLVSMTGTFLRSVLLGKKEQVRIGEGAIVTMGATTFILHVPGGEEEEDF